MPPKSCLKVTRYSVRPFPLEDYSFVGVARCYGHYPPKFDYDGVMRLLQHTSLSGY